MNTKPKTQPDPTLIEAMTAEAAPPTVPDLGENSLLVAMCAVMNEIKVLERDGTNAHASYNYASVDAFYSMIRPLMARHGLVLFQQEDHVEYIDLPVTRKNVDVLRKFMAVSYVFTLMHKSGIVGPEMRRTITVEMGGPQQWGQAQSYADKQVLRSLFKIATGEADADASEPVTVAEVAMLNVEDSAKIADGFIDMAKRATDPDDLDAMWWQLRTAGAGMASTDKERCARVRRQVLAKMAGKLIPATEGAPA